MSVCDCELSHNGLGLSGRECDCPAGDVETSKLKALQSWVYQQRVALQITDPDYFAKYDVWKAVGVQIRAALSK